MTSFQLTISVLIEVNLMQRQNGTTCRNIILFIVHDSTVEILLCVLC